MSEAANDAMFGARRGLPDNPFTQSTTNGPLPPGVGRPQGAGRGPDPVHIVSGDPQFFNALSQSLGLNQGQQGNTQGPPGLNPIITGQQALLAQTAQIVTDMQQAAQMALQTQTSNQAWSTQMRLQQQQHSAQMQSLLATINNHITTTNQTSSQLNQLIGVVTSSMGALPGQMQAMVNALTQGLAGLQGAGGGGGGPNGPGGGNYLRWSARNSFASKMASTYGASSWQARAAGGFAAGGFQGALRAAPYVGVGMAVADEVNEAATWLTNQGAENRKFSAVTGGQPMPDDIYGSLAAAMGGPETDDRSGLGQRIQQMGFILGQRFSPSGMTEDMSREAFQGTTSLGYVGDKRAEALDFITKQYKELGVTVEESMQVLSVSAQHANSSLGGVTEGLNKVTQAAVATGQNAQLLRQQFVGAYGNALAMGAGASAGTLAQGWTMAGAGTNRDLANIDYGAVMNNPGLMRLIAGTNGQSPGQLYADLARGNTGAFAATQQKMINRNLTGIMGQKVRDSLSRLVQEGGGNEQVGRSQVAQRQIAIALLEQNPTLNIDAARAALENSGVDTSGLTDPVQIVEAMVSNLVGGGPQAQIDAAAADNTMQDLKGEENQFIKDFRDKRDSADHDIGWGDSVSEFFGGTSASGNKYRAMNDSYNAYKDKQSQTGKSNPAIEALIDKYGGSTDVRVQVMTKDGPRVVHMNEAIAHFADQLSSGEAVLMGAGEDSGKRVSEAIGFRVGGFKAGEKGYEDSTTKSAPVGQSVEDYQKANPNKTSSGNQSNTTVTISASPELKRLFRFAGDGVNIDGAASVGRPPVVPNR